MSCEALPASKRSLGPTSEAATYACRVNDLKRSSLHIAEIASLPRQGWDLEEREATSDSDAT